MADEPQANAFAEAETPVQLDLELGRQVLRVQWADGKEVTYPAAFLRSRCPCAACHTERERQSRSLLPVLSAAQSKPARAVGGHTIGNYALQIEWSDGHDTGIYDFRLLRRLAGELPAAPEKKQR
jgi:DUF971 family protein